VYGAIGTAVRKPVYLTLAGTADGQKELLGLRIGQKGGCGLWLSVMNGLKNRDVAGHIISGGCETDRISRYPRYGVSPNRDIVPRSTPSTQPGPVCPRKDRKAVAGSRKKIYLALPAGLPDEGAKVREKKYPMIAESWRSWWKETFRFSRFRPGLGRPLSTRQEHLENRETYPLLKVIAAWDRKAWR
jgi:transposase-like protein